MIHGNVSLEKAAKILGMTTRAMRKLRDDGILFFVQVGGQWRVPFRELERYKAEQEARDGGSESILQRVQQSRRALEHMRQSGAPSKPSKA